MKAEIKDVGLHGEDLQGFNVYNEDDNIQPKSHEEIWFQTTTASPQNDSTHQQNNNNHLLDVDMDVSDPSSLFYADDFPELPDFPCMSSSSSSSSAPAITKPVTSSATSSSASTATSSSGHGHGQRSGGHGGDGGGGDGGGSEMCVGSSMAVEDVDECMDMMENFGCIDLLESASDICWDPSPFDDNSHANDNGDEHQLLLKQQQQQLMEREDEEERAFEEFMMQGGGGGGEESTNTTTNGSTAVAVVDDVVGGFGDTTNNVNNNQVEQQPSSDDLAMVFFEWLKTNKEAISAEDLRNIKIKKSTIESAAKRLGGGKEGMKQLLKLILQWVQNHHLQNKRMIVRDGSIVSTNSNNTCAPGIVEDHTNSVSNNNDNNNNNSISEPNPNPSPLPPPLDQQPPNPTTSCFSQPAAATWLPAPQPAPFVGDPTAIVPAPPAPMVGYMGQDPYSTGLAYPPTDGYQQMMDTTTAHAWAPSPATMQFGMGPTQYGVPYPDPTHAAQFGAGYPTPYPGGFYYHPGPSEGLVRLGSSATKEARKKRMARQRRFFTHHHRSQHQHHNHNHMQNNQLMNNNNNMMVDQHAGVGNGSCGTVAPHHNPAGNWVYWAHPPPPQPQPPQVSHPVSGPPAVVGQMQGLERPAPPGNGFQRQVGGGVEKKQGWKTEKNLRFLLQKVLKQSDVGNLGRIVLPKKEAETHLPELEARDGIPIAMEDIGTSRVWNMRYRFWPNNKSRMYLLENTGDFVRSNGLQEGDFIVIYSDVKCGKYMIRGVKVRPQQQGAKPETANKKSVKTQKTQGCSSPAGSGLCSSPSSMQRLV